MHGIVRLSFFLLSWAFASCNAHSTERVSAKEIPFIFGVGAHVMPGWHNPEDLTNVVRQVGFNSFRDDAFWQRLERNQGEFRLDASAQKFFSMLHEANDSGLWPLVILDYGNKFYDKGDFPQSKEGISGFLEYVKYVMDAVKGQRLYQVWNEWNIGLGLPSDIKRKGAASDYLSLLRNVSPLIRSANPDALVVSTSIARLDINWLQQFVDGGGLKLVDAVSLHPYVWSQKASKPEDAIAWLGQAQEVLRKANGGKDFPVFVTEIGWPSHSAPAGVSEGGAADFAVRFFLLARQQKWIKGVWWYDLIDDGLDPKDWEHHFGMLRHDGSQKPIVTALQSLSEIIRSGRPNGLSRTVGGIMKAGFDLPDGCKVFSLWTIDGSMQRISYQGSQPLVLAYSGGAPPVLASSGQLLLTGSPIIIKSCGTSIAFERLSAF
jgi:hypothetical protein